MALRHHLQWITDGRHDILWVKDEVLDLFVFRMVCTDFPPVTEAIFAIVSLIRMSVFSFLPRAQVQFVPGEDPEHLLPAAQGRPGRLQRIRG